MYPDELYHHGILGQKWGVRRYQNADGSLTGAGRKRYGFHPIKNFKRKRAAKKAVKTREQNAMTKRELKAAKEEWAKNIKTLNEHFDEFTNEEIQEAMNRLKLKASVSEMNMNRIKAGLQYIDMAGNLGKDITNIATALMTADKAYKQIMPNTEPLTQQQKLLEKLSNQTLLAQAKANKLDADTGLIKSENAYKEAKNPTKPTVEKPAQKSARELAIEEQDMQEKYNTAAAKNLEAANKLIKAQLENDRLTKKTVNEAKEEIEKEND